MGPGAIGGSWSSSAEVGVVSRALGTGEAGQALLVFNPLALAREDVIEAVVRFPGGAPAAVRVRGPDGSAVPAQLAAATGELASVTFVARVAPLSFAVFDKAAERELLAAPLRLQLFGDEPRKWAAWEIE